MEWILSPLANFIVLAVGMGLCLLLFVTLKRDVFRAHRHIHRVEMAWPLAFAEFKNTTDEGVARQDSTISEIRQELKELVERVSLLTPSVPPSNGINLTKRTQVLQLARRGNRPDQIAACLHVPQNEVDLVLKVHRTIIRTF